MSGTSRPPTLFDRIYAVVARIPRGRVATYGQIGARVGGLTTGRVVGFAMRVAPSGLPCHRVVNRLGDMAPGDCFGGAEAQRQRLHREGVRFRPDGRIDLAASTWSFDSAEAENEDDTNSQAPQHPPSNRPPRRKKSKAAPRRPSPDSPSRKAKTTKSEGG